MITKLNLKNFKTFGDSLQTIPLKKLTLIFGANSSGKSSIIHSLLLLKQSAMDTSIILLPKGNMIDLGTFKEMIYCHLSDKIMSIGIEIDGKEEITWDFESKENIISIKSFNGRTSKFVRHLENAFFGSYGFDAEKIDCKNYPFVKTIKKLTKDINSKISISLSADTYCYSFNIQTEKFLTVLMKRKPQRDKLLRKLEEWGVAGEEFTKVLDKLPEKLKSNKNYFDQELSDIDKDIIEHIDLPYRDWKLYNKNFYQWCENQFFEEIDDASEPHYHIMREIATKYPRIEEKDINSIKEFISSNKQVTKKYIKELKDLKDESDRIELAEHLGSMIQFFDFIMTKNPIQFKLREEDSYYDETSYYAFEEYLYLTMDLLRPLEIFSQVVSKFWEIIDKVVFIGPIRQKPERYYFSGGYIPLNVGQVGEKTAELMFHNKKLVNQINHAFEFFNIDYEVFVKPVSDSSSDVFTITLLDKKSHTEVSQSDVGFGLSQLLPIIVQAYIATNKIICIEQPEIHLHPKLQSKLGEFFINRINETEDCQFIIETHSEHLLLRVQNLIRKGILSKEDVEILYVEKSEKATVVYPLEINKRGEFIDSWPDDFIDQNLEDILG